MNKPNGGPITYWPAHDALKGFVTGYHRYAVALPPGLVLKDAFFPSVATIRIAVQDSADWSLRIGTRSFSPVPSAVLTGPTSYAGYVESGGGTLVGAGILPAGWARLFGGDVSRYANRVVPLEQLDGGAGDLVRALEMGENPTAAFDEWLLARLDRGSRPDPRIGEIQALLDDPAVCRIEAICQQLGLSPRALATVTRFNFGFTPKLLLRRTRFLRALSIVLSDEGGSDDPLSATGYWDRSHFLRDCHLFLGCSVREFNKRRGVFNQLAMKERTRVLGAPV